MMKSHVPARRSISSGHGPFNQSVKAYQITPKKIMKNDKSMSSIMALDQSGSHLTPKSFSQAPKFNNIFNFNKKI